MDVYVCETCGARFPMAELERTENGFVEVCPECYGYDIEKYFTLE